MGSFLAGCFFFMCFFLADKRLPQDYPLYGGFGKDEDGFWPKKWHFGGICAQTNDYVEEKHHIFS
jgi:hypothetical protein